MLVLYISILLISCFLLLNIQKLGLLVLFISIAGLLFPIIKYSGIRTVSLLFISIADPLGLLVLLISIADLLFPIIIIFRS